MQARPLSNIGRYTIRRELGRGGMGIVYEAYDEAFERPVALKVLPRDRMSDESVRTRFQREARLIAALEHEGIVPVYDYGEENDTPYFVMRFLTGGSLAERLQDGPLPVEEAIGLVEKVAPALDHAHSRPIIHRDLKPGNILFDEHGLPYICDFGIAKLALTGQSAVSQVMGTPSYMSPEQIEGTQKLDGRSDLYALAVIFWEMVTGDVPYQADTPIRVALEHLQAPIPKLNTRYPSLPAALDRVLERALAKKASDRFPTATAFAQALRAAVPATTVVRPALRQTPSQGVSRSNTPRPTTGGAPAGRRSPSQTLPPTARRSLPMLPILLGLGICVVLGVGALLLNEGGTTSQPVNSSGIQLGASGSEETSAADGGRGASLPTQEANEISFVTSTARPDAPTNTPIPPTSTLLAVVTTSTPRGEATGGGAATANRNAVVQQASPADAVTVPSTVTFTVSASGMVQGDRLLLLVGTMRNLSGSNQQGVFQATGSSHTATLNNVAPGTYFWTAWLVDAGGRFVTSASVRAFTVAGGGNVPPVQPTTPPPPTAVPPTVPPPPPTAIPPTSPPPPPTAIPPTSPPPPPTAIPPTVPPLPPTVPPPISTPPTQPEPTTTVVIVPTSPPPDTPTPPLPDTPTPPPPPPGG